MRGSHPSRFTKKKSSLYFVRAANKVVDVEHVMTMLALKGTASNTASNPSLAKLEIVRLYKAYMSELDTVAPLNTSLEITTVTSSDDTLELGHTALERGPGDAG